MVGFNDYLPGGSPMLGRTFSSNKYRRGFNGMEKDDELKGEGNSYDFGARMYDPRLGRFLSVDPKADQRVSLSPYNSMSNNPINRIDPDGQLDDWVQDDITGDISWDKNANSQATTKEGQTYLGKTLNFTFNSYIDGSNWDGPYPLIGPSPPGDKLTSTLSITGNENSAGELMNITATMPYGKPIVGPTPWGTARDFYPGLGADQNKFGFSSSQYNTNGVLTSTSFNFEQHASVSSLEEIGMKQGGYNIVNVAQKLTLNYSNSKLSLSTYTDIFPSATLSMNGIQMMHYQQPSFKQTHSLKTIGYTPPSLKDNTTGGRPIYEGYKKAMWYER